MLKKRKNHSEHPPVAIASSQSPSSEEFRRLRANINFSSAGRELQTLVITSAEAFEGKSWIAFNLAVIFAQEGKKVLLVDSDMRKPSAHETFHFSNDTGISNVLEGQFKAESAIRKTFFEHLELLACGPVPHNPAELLASEFMDSFMENMKKRYDLIIFDSPPLLSVVDGQILANKCDGSILVINSGKTDRQKAIKAKDAIALSNGRLMGVIINNFLTPQGSG